MAPSRGGIVIFSGGSAANSLVDVFESIRRSRSCLLSYIIPISDNGGSSSELIRVFGGPGIGDVRSRLVRLIPQQPYSKEREAIGNLLSSRLSSSNARDAREGWSEIVDGTSPLWKDISSAKKELIRSFLNSINLEILKRSRPPTSTFDFRSASIGNLFLTGARLFSGSFESAIYLLSAVCGIPDEEIRVIPSINSNFSHHIAAELEDGSVIVGQNSISHPSLEVAFTANLKKGQLQLQNRIERSEALSAYTSASQLSLNHSNGEADMQQEETEEEDAHPPFTLKTLRASNITFTKAAEELDSLPSRINRVHYVNSFGQEILPPANPRAIQALQNAEYIIYSIGSLYTSIVPNLVLRGIGDTMRKTSASMKILILNGCLDREVGPEEVDKPFTAVGFINAIVKAGEQSRGVVWTPTATIDESQTGFPRIGGVQDNVLHRPALQRVRSEGLTLVKDARAGVKPLPPPMLASAMPSRAQSPSQSPDRGGQSKPPATLTSEIPRARDPIYKHYVTHLIHISNSPDTPHVDQELLAAQYGIKCIRVYGRRNKSGPGMLYDPQALKGAIEAVLGGRAHEQAVSDPLDAVPQRSRFQNRDRGRRNTVET